MRKSTHKLGVVALLVAALATVVGCSGKPSGFPKVSPCEITVTDGAEPIADVDVALIPSTPISGVIAGGKTDATGKCVVATTFANFSAPGAPDGSFSVTLRKDPTPTKPALTIEEMADMDRSEIDKYNKERDAEIQKMPKIIPPNLTSAQTTPVKVNVPGDSAVSVDVSQYR